MSLLKAWSRPEYILACFTCYRQFCDFSFRLPVLTTLFSFSSPYKSVRGMNGGVIFLLVVRRIGILTSSKENQSFVQRYKWKLAYRSSGCSPLSLSSLVFHPLPDHLFSDLHAQSPSLRAANSKFERKRELSTPRVCVYVQLR